MAKVLCALYSDPEIGYPPKYARELNLRTRTAGRDVPRESREKQ